MYVFSIPGYELLYLLGTVLLKGFLFLLGVFLFQKGFRRVSAKLRHQVWVGAFVILILLPVLVVALPAWDVYILPPAEVSANRVEASLLIASETTGSVIEADPSLFWRGLPWLIVLWASGVLVATARLGFELKNMAGLSRRAQPAEEAWEKVAQSVGMELGVKRSVRLKMTADLNVPVAWGLWRPLVVLPAAAHHWSPELRRIVLLHEVVHIKRHDFLTNLLSQITLAFHWINPLMWLACRRMAVEREHACDAMVVTSGINPSEYALYLIQVAREALANRPPPSVSIAMASMGPLEERIRALILPRHSTANPGWFSQGGLVALCLLFGLVLTAMRPTTKAVLIEGNASVQVAEQREQQRERIENTQPPAPERAQAHPAPLQEEPDAKQPVREPMDAKADFALKVPSTWLAGAMWSLQLPHKGFVEVELFTLAGSRASTLLSERLEAGTHQFDIAKPSLKPGSYMLTARFEGKQHIKQIRIPNN